MNALWAGLRRWRWEAAGLAAVVVFAMLAGRFWHPYYGFTKFIQLDEADARNGIHEIREHPVFVYEGFNGYDGAAYAQIAFHPWLDSPELQPAIGNVPYRARRILASALAWLLAGGEPARIAHTYAALNPGVWLVLALVLWRVLPVTDGRSWLAWVGVMFSAGALHSVRLALTDLLATLLVAVAIVWHERGRSFVATVVLGAAGLARETAHGAVVALWRGPWGSFPAWRKNLLRTFLVALPLVLWALYVQWKAGPAAQGFGNLTWPIVGWIEKLRQTLADYARQPDFRWLNTTTLLALVALTVQALFFLRRWRLDNAWWRAGICGAGLMALLGTSVWEGHPGAATRVLLPMGVAFAVLAVRERAGWGWILAGSLGVFSGVLALWHVPQDSREIGAGRFAGGVYVARLESGWFGVERNRREAWAWSAGRGTLRIETEPRVTNSRPVRLKLRAIGSRTVEIRGGEQVLWRGLVSEKPEWIEFATVPREPGRITLDLIADAPAVRENERADARALSFAVQGVDVK